MYEQDKSLGQWVATQRNHHVNNKLRLDRKGILDEIGFAWKAHIDNENDKLWHQQYEKLVELKREKGHCLVPRKHDQHKSLEQWVRKQRYCYFHNKIRLDREELLDEIEFVWKTGTGPARYSTSSSVSLPNEALVQESERARDDASNRLECQEEATPPGEIPSGWTRVKLEPDC
jgi:hypothetical protein